MYQDCLTTLVALYIDDTHFIEEYEEVCTMTGFRTRFQILCNLKTGRAEALKQLGPT